ncbi:hypothetical protein ACQ86N_27910 [Puia sp. P3]|uniref:hypothetical protein n=1 Tax=Puia sp. P3 TaxID=3423952 RepID=UPI003D675ACC
MKHLFYKTTLTLSILLFSKIVWAQCPTCDAALARDTRDYYHTTLHTDFKDVLTEIFSHDFTYYKSGAWKSNTNFQSGGSYGVIKWFLRRQ